MTQAFSNKYKLSGFVVVKLNNWNYHLLTFDPQIIIDYFNYLPVNVWILPLSDYVKENYEDLESFPTWELDTLHIKPSNIKITNVSNAPNWEPLSKLSKNATRLLDHILKLSISKNASDIHLEVEKINWSVWYRVRYRIDWKLTVIERWYDMEVFLWICTQIKLNSWLKLDESRLPQDWRLSYTIYWQVSNFRISTKPIVLSDLREWWERNFEKIVIRKMPDVWSINLQKLWYEDYNIKLLSDVSNLQSGFNIITWPTWSWKTTLLYALLWDIDTISKNVSTIEDPVEAELSNISQTQIMPNIWFDFANALRAELRQDPDIIMIGEIRDKLTAKIAAEASLTWHLVFSTLHTSSAISSITRLINMGIPSYIVASSLTSCISQRLISKLCNECKIRVPNTDRFKQLKIAPIIRDIKNPRVLDLFSQKLKKAEFYMKNPKWCNHCTNWFAWRTSICEVFKLTDKYEQIILSWDISETKLKSLAEKQWMISMQLDWLYKVMEWTICIEELYYTLLK